MANYYPGKNLDYDLIAGFGIMDLMDCVHANPAIFVSIEYCHKEIKKKFPQFNDSSLTDIHAMTWVSPRFDEFCDYFKVGSNGEVDVGKFQEVKAFNGDVYYIHPRMPIMYVDNDSLSKKANCGTFKGFVYLA